MRITDLTAARRAEARERSSTAGAACDEVKAGSFDRIAPAYRWLEYGCFGRALERCRTLQLGQIPGKASVLVLGDGDGRFTSALLARHEQCHVVALDASAAMLELLRARVRAIGAAHRLRTFHGDALWLLAASFSSRTTGPESVSLVALNRPKTARVPRAARLPETADNNTQGSLPPARFDCVCSHFFLDCLTTAQVEQLTRDLVPRLAPDACWVVSEFETPSWWTRRLVSALYLAFGLLAGLEVRCLPDWRRVLEQQGFTCVQETRLLRGLIASSLWLNAGQPAESPL